VRLRRGAEHLWVTCALALASAALAFAATGATASTTNVVPLPLCCIPSGPVDAIAVDGNTAYVGGAFTHLGLPRHHLALIDPSSGQPQDGTPRVEGNFVSPPIPDGGFINTSIPDGGGGWYVAGSFTSIGGVPRAGLAHLFADKSIDPNWAPTTDGTVKAIARDAAGNVYVGGSFSHVNGSTARSNLAAFDANGQATAFNPAPDGPVNALGTSFRIQILGGGTTATFARLYVGGAFMNIAGMLRADFAVFDLHDDSLAGSDPAMDGPVTAMAVAPGHSSTQAAVYLGGSFTHASGQARNHMAAFDENGVLTSFNAPVDVAPTALAVNGTSVFIGGVGAEGGQVRHGLAAVKPDTGADQPGFAPTISGNLVPPTAVRSIVTSGGSVYIGGRFTSVNGKPRNNLAAVDANNGGTLDWDPDAPGLNTGVTHLGFDGTSMLVSGEFDEIGGPARNNVAAIDMTTGQVSPFDPNADGEVSALAVQGQTLYMGGAFTHVGTNVRNAAAAVDKDSGVPTPFDPNVDISTSAKPITALAPAGGSIFIGGEFSQVGGAPRAEFAQVDAQTGVVTPLKADLDNVPTGFAFAGDTLFLAGRFTHIGGVARNGFAALQNGQVTPLDPQPDGFSSSVLVHGSTLYLGGNFQHVLNGIPRARMAAFNTGNVALLPFDAPFDSEPDGLADDDSELFAVGPAISSVSGAPRENVGAVDLATGVANPWAPSFATNTQLSSIGLSRGAGLAVGGFVSFNGGGALSLFAIAPSTPAAPQASADAPGQATVAFSAPPSGGSPVQYTVTASPGGQTATGSGSPIVVTGLTPGTTYTFTVAGANAAGQGLTSAPSNAVTVTSPAGTPGPVPGGRALSASAFKLTHKRFAVGKAKTALSARKTPIGTVFTFRLSAAATTRITIAQELRGVKKGKRCVAPRKGLRKRCTRLKTMGTLTRKHGKAGSNRVPFSGRLGKTPLKPGTYKATLVATDAAGRRSKPVSATFVAVKALKKR
jgi:fibronectin type III domain protein/beta-propeller uncharacterized protein DUF5122